jgi:hypothetical protein
MERNGQTIYQAEPCRVHSSEFAGFTRKGNTLIYARAFLAGRDGGAGRIEEQGEIGAAVGRAARPVEFEQEQFRVRFTGCRRMRRTIR